MPKYDYKCRVCDFVEEVTHGFHESPDLFCMDCGGVMGKLMSVPRISPSAVPTRGSVIDMDATRKAEKQKVADMDAYKRLRKNGVQPPAINGSARLEAKAEEKHEVNSGHTFATSSARKRSMSLVKDVVGE